MSDTAPDLTGIRTSQSQIRNADYRELDRTKLSPMYQHYVEVKSQYPHALLLYRCGDFFETFFQDAITIARELELVLTSKEGGKEIGRVPMTGVPHHAVDRYCAMLVGKRLRDRHLRPN
jgi:DNA mismatch repair protein MutS